MAKPPETFESVEMIRPRLEIGPAIKLFLALDGIGCLLTLLAPEWTGRWLAQSNPAVFGSLHVWTLWTGTIAIGDVGTLLYVLCLVFFVLREVEIALRPKWFWFYWLTTTLAGTLAGWCLLPTADFPAALVPPLAACGATWHLSRFARWNVWGIEMKARTGIALAVLMGILFPLVGRQFAVLTAWGIAFAAGYGCIRLLEWRDSGSPLRRSVKTEVKSHYIELD